MASDYNNRNSAERLWKINNINLAVLFIPSSLISKASVIQQQWLQGCWLLSLFSLENKYCIIHVNVFTAHVDILLH